MSELRPAPLVMNATEARCGIPGTDWGGLGIGLHTFRRRVRSGEIPSTTFKDSETVWFHRGALEEWSRNNGRTAA